MELIVYIGSSFLAINAVPELIRTINDGRCHIGWPMLVLWLLGEIFTTVYAISLGNIPLIMNYVFNLFIVIVMLWYKLRTIYVTDKYIEKDDLIITKL